MSGIINLYTANGQKLMKQIRTEKAREQTVDYIGSFVYESDQLRYILTEEGRALAKSNGTFEYQYFLKDHLGNTRITFSQNGQIIQEDAYYPFGMQMNGLCYQSGVDYENKYLYNGKELQDEFGLDWYDYGARMYDAVIGRWHVVDPASNFSHILSPYSYCFNNPIRFVDPDGMVVDDFYFDQTGNMKNRIKNSNPDRFFVETGNTKKTSQFQESSTPNGTVCKLVKKESPEYKEVKMDSDVGTMARAVYAEMGGEDQNSMQIAAKSIKNRTELPETTYEHADSYKAAIDMAYDVSKPSDLANERYTNPQKSTNKNPGDREAFVRAVGVSIKVDNSSKSERIGQGVIFYNSISSTIYDKNKNMQKINLNVSASGIKGTLKLKKD